MNKQLETTLWKVVKDARALLEHMQDFPQNRTQREMLKKTLATSVQEADELNRK